jgi:tetratricopeptide (TPR) repeat protein
MPEKILNDLPRELRVLYTKGFEALQRDNFDYAIELFSQILEKEPSNFDVRKSLRAAQGGKTGKAGGFFKRAFSSASSSPQVAKGQMALRRNPAEAMAIAEQILNGDANSPGGHKLFADAALAADMPKSAVLSLEVLRTLQPKDKEVGMKLAEAWATAGDKTKAEAIYTELQQEYPNDNQIFQAFKDLSARKTLDEGGYEALSGGKGSYRDILKDKDQSVRIEQENRQVKAADSTEELMRDWEGRLEKEPNNMKMLRNLAETYAQRNDFEKSLSYYDRMLAVDGGNDAALLKQIADIKIRRFTYALSQLDQSSPDYEARAEQIKAERQAYQLEECKQRSERYPTDLQIKFELGQLYYEAGKISEAIQELQKAKSSPHRKTQALVMLARCFEKRGMNELAAKQLQEALKDRPGFDDEKKETIYTLASILEKMGKKEEAIQQYLTIYENDIAYKDVEAKVNAHYAGGG